MTPSVPLLALRDGFLSNKKRISSALLASFLIICVRQLKNGSPRSLSSQELSPTSLKLKQDEQMSNTIANTRGLFLKEVQGRGKVGINQEFLHQLKAIIKICIPSFKSKEVLLLVLHTLFLLLRTYLSLVVAKLDGTIVRDLVAANLTQFLKGLGYWFAIAVPATYTNSMIKYLQSVRGSFRRVLKVTLSCIFFG
jgi:hypothetical protein